MSEVPILLILLPLGGAGLCLLGKFSPRLWIAKGISMFTLACCLALLLVLYPGRGADFPGVYTVGGWNPAVGIQQIFDGLAWISCALVFSVSLLALLFAFAENAYEVTFYFFYLMSVAGMIAVILAADLFNMFVCFEILGIAAYILIAYFQKGHAVLASFKYLVLSSLGMALMLLGIFIIYQETGSLSLLEVSRHLARQPALSRKMLIAVAALVAGIGVRSAFIPFHTWLPDAHAYAPHPVSAVLSGLVIKVSFLALWRILSILQLVTIQHLFIAIGATTALFGVMWALAQTDCKQLLAWHSISQMGYILASFGVGTPQARVASYAHIMNHALFKSLLFLCIGSVIHVTGERNLKKLGNLGPLMPVLALLFLAGACSIAGIPPFNGFVSKKLILSSLETSPLASGALSIASVGTVASFVKLSAIFRKREPQAGIGALVSGTLPGLIYLPLTILASVCLFSGLFGRRLIAQISFFLLGNALPLSSGFYSFSTLLKTAVTVGLGLAVYRGILTPPGQRLLTRIRSWQPDFDTSLLLLLAGFILFALAVMFCYVP